MQRSAVKFTNMDSYRMGGGGPDPQVAPLIYIIGLIIILQYIVGKG